MAAARSLDDLITLTSVPVPISFPLSSLFVPHECIYDTYASEPREISFKVPVENRHRFLLNPERRLAKHPKEEEYINIIHNRIATSLAEEDFSWPLKR